MDPLLRILNTTSQLVMMRNATWTFSNLYFAKVSPALSVLSKLLFHSDPDVLSDACWSLSHLCSSSNDRIQAVIDAGVSRRLLRRGCAIRTIGNILTGDDLQTQVMLNVSAIPALHALLSHPGDNIRKEACWSISNVLAGNQMQIQSVIDAGVIPTIIELLDKAETKIRREAAWSITNA
ncbi:Karyopherin alpha 6like, partial [Caligus rogercresseyi]